MKNTLVLDALNCRNRGRTPVWLMRQAGRYMPQYRALRQKYSFMEMCKTPELAAEITMLPINEFGFDAAIMFSDILVILDALGAGLHFEEKVGPVIERPVSCWNDVEKLSPTSIPEKLSYVGDAIRLLKSQLDRPLLGFCGAPFTVASYLIEGGSSRDLKKTKQWMLRDPESFHRLLALIAECTIDYLNMQVDAGVDAIQIFDSWAHVLAEQQFREFSLSYMERVMRGIKNRELPVILFCKASSLFAPLLAEIRPAAISLDWNGDVAQIRQNLSQGIALQGNLDPDVLYAPAAKIRQEVQRLLESMKNDPGYVFNLGHGIHPDIPVDSVRVLVETIREGS